MRGLLFRVWNGTEMEYNVTVGKFGAFYVNPMTKGDGLDEKDSASLTPFNTKYFDETPVMQYTGLKDKNGKEIYEGDLFQVAGNNIYTVKYFEESENNFEKAYACFCLTIPEKMTFPIDEWAIKNGHVVGNIFETPHLIEQ